jgi:hypothetical protein
MEQVHRERVRIHFDGGRRPYEYAVKTSMSYNNTQNTNWLRSHYTFTYHAWVSICEFNLGSRLLWENVKWHM